MISSSPASFHEPLSSLKLDFTLSFSYWTNLLSKVKVVVLLAALLSLSNAISASLTRLVFLEMIEKKFFCSITSDNI